MLQEASWTVCLRCGWCPFSAGRLIRHVLGDYLQMGIDGGLKKKEKMVIIGVR